MRQKRLDRKEGIESARRWKSGGERERDRVQKSGSGSHQMQWKKDMRKQEERDDCEDFRNKGSIILVLFFNQSHG